MVFHITDFLHQVEELEKRGKDIIHLERGEPDFDTPNHIKEAAKKALVEGYTKYTERQGILRLREAISEYYNSRGADLKPDNVMITPGSKFAIYTMMKILLKGQEEVLCFEPYWPDYRIIAGYLNRRFIGLKILDDGKKFSPDLNDLQEKVSSKTKMIIINSPHNPTGMVMSLKELRAILEVTEEKGIFILSDEVYDRINFTGEVTILLSITNNLERVIVINSFSKTYAMTGWRLGYVISSPEILKRAIDFQASTVTCASSISQVAGIAAIKGSQEPVQTMVAEYDRRRRILVEGLNKMGIRCNMPMGTFYSFPYIRNLGLSSEELTYRLLREGIACLPGSMFGNRGEGYLRLAFTTKMERILEALKRMEQIFK
jgi:aminotransferase